MISNRTGEEGIIPHRAERFFQLENSWYFATREGVNMGPYESINTAKDGLSDFLDFVALAQPDTLRSFTEALVRKAGEDQLSA